MGPGMQCQRRPVERDAIARRTIDDLKPVRPTPDLVTLASIPLGTVVHAIELKTGRGAQIVRAAGGSAQLMAREGGLATLRLPSGELRLVRVTCVATVGQVGNLDHENQSIGKAGRSRWLGVRPSVRGAAMNPVDHNNGGCEGRAKGGKPPSPPLGKMARGLRTRNNKRTDRFVVTPRRRGKQSGGK